MALCQSIQQRYIVESLANAKPFSKINETQREKYSYENKASHICQTLTLLISFTNDLIF
jgi:hypothetical protein